MEDIAMLGLGVDSRPVDQGRDSLKKFEDQAGRTELATRGLEHTTGLLTRAMGLLGAAFSVSELIRMTSVWTDLNSRVKNAVSAHESANDVMNRIDEMARRTYSSLEQTAESYLRNAASLTALGYSTSQQLDLTESLNNALVVSAIKGQAAENVMNAWSKAMALGKLNGDNLNTVIMSGGRVAEALADSMGVSVLELRKLGAEGKITGKEMFGITSQLEKLREEADAMPATIQDAFTLLGNALLSTVGRLDEATGASTALADAIIFVGDHADALIPIIGALAGLIAVTLVPSIVAATAAMIAFAATPIGIVAIAIAALAGAVTYLWNEQRKADQAAKDHAEAIETNAKAIEVARKASQDFRQELRDQIAMQAEAARAALTEADAQTAAARAKAVSQRFELFGMKFGNAFAEGDANAKLAKSLALDKAMQELEAQLAEIDAVMLTKPGADKPGLPIDPTKDQVKAAKAYADLILGSRQFIEQQQLEASVLGMTSEAASRLRYEQEMLNKAANDNIKLTPVQREQIAGLASAMAAAEEQTRILTEVYDTGKGIFTSFLSDLKSGLMDGATLWEALGEAGMNALETIANKALDMAASGIWDMIFGAIKGTLLGGFGSLGNDIGTGASFAGVQSFLKSANGNVFQSGISGYSSQVVSQPTVFPFANGIGLMGEAGPEAIMPLKRAPDGRLGVEFANQNAPARDEIRIGVEVYVRDDGKLAVIARQEGGRAAQVVVLETVPNMIKNQAPAAVASTQRDRRFG